MTAAEMINLGEKKSPIRENFEYGRQRMEQIGKEKVLFLLPDFAYLLNIVLDILFIKTFNMGVAGAAIATVFAQMMSFVVCMAYMKKYYSTLFINMLHLQFDKAELKKSLKIGTPAMIQQVFVSIGFMSLQFLINRFGTDCMAAYTAASKVDAFAEMPALNLGQAMTNFISNSFAFPLRQAIFHRHLRLAPPVA